MKTRARSKIDTTPVSHYYSTNEDGEPLVPCYDTGRQYVFWCPYCRAVHYHGRFEGSRTAHCHSGSSLLGRTEYILVLAGEIPKGASARTYAKKMHNLRAQEA